MVQIVRGLVLPHSEQRDYFGAIPSVSLHSPLGKSDTLEIWVASHRQYKAGNSTTLPAYASLECPDFATILGCQVASPEFSSSGHNSFCLYVLRPLKWLEPSHMQSSDSSSTGPCSPGTKQVMCKPRKHKTLYSLAVGPLFQTSIGLGSTQ